MSSVGWLIALALVQSKVLTASGWNVFVERVPLANLGSLGVATLGLITLHLRSRPAGHPAA